MGSFGSGRLGNEGVSSPSRLSGLPASAPRTAHLCRSRGAGDSRAAGARGAERGWSPCCAVLPKTISFYLLCVPPNRRPVRSLKLRTDKAGMLQNRDRGGVKRK